MRKGTQEKYDSLEPRPDRIRTPEEPPRKRSEERVASISRRAATWPAQVGAAT